MLLRVRRRVGIVVVVGIGVGLGGGAVLTVFLPVGTDATTAYIHTSLTATMTPSVVECSSAFARSDAREDRSSHIVLEKYWQTSASTTKVEYGGCLYSIFGRMQWMFFSRFFHFSPPPPKNIHIFSVV